MGTNAPVVPCSTDRKATSFHIDRAQRQGSLVGSQKCRETRRLIASSFQVHPKVFVFFDRLTNTKRFEVKAGPDGSLPVEQAISLLAMQCVVRGQSPGDFRVLVSTGENLLDGLMPRTKKLIQHCMATVLPIHDP